MRAVFGQVASGLPLGPEGPLVHIGAGVASFFTRQHSFRLFGRQIGGGMLSKSDFDMFNNDFDRREFISSGAAVGLATAFGAPIGGVLYALEETSSFWSQRVTWRALLCTTFGTFTLAFFQGKGKYIGASGLLSFAGQPNAYFVWELIPFVVIAMCGGAFGALFVATYKRAEQYRQKSDIGKLGEAAAVVLIVALVSYLISDGGKMFVYDPELEAQQTEDQRQKQLAAHVSTPQQPAAPSLLASLADLHGSSLLAFLLHAPWNRMKYAAARLPQLCCPRLQR